MSYSLNIPTSGQTLGNTQGPILTNFAVLNTSNNVNHEAFNSANQGKHKFLQMPEQSAAPTTAANEGGFYSKVGISPAETDLFFRAESSGFEYQLTRAISSATATMGNNTAYAANHRGGWTFLAGNSTNGGLLFQYGARSSPGTSGTITFPTPFTTGYFSITFGLSRSASSSVQNVYVDNSIAVSLLNFAYTNTSNNSDPIFWMAIGI